MKERNIFNADIYSTKRTLELAIEALQGLEQIASQAPDCSAAEVGKAMVPMIFELERVQGLLEKLHSQSECEGKNVVDFLSAVENPPESH